MAIYLIDYIVYTSGHRRHHRGTQTTLLHTQTGIATAGDSLAIPVFPSLPYNNQELSFAFMAVAGGADGSILYTSPDTQNIKVSNSDIKALIVYAPQGIGGPNIPEVIVDAFNVDIADFSDSDFMQVFTNNALDNAKTNTANNDGIVSSVSPEDMRSYSKVDNVPFLKWQLLEGASDNQVDYQLKQNQGGMVFAFFQTPPSKKTPTIKIPNEKEWEIYAKIIGGISVDGGGFTLVGGKLTPVSPLGPIEINRQNQRLR